MIGNQKSYVMINMKRILYVLFFLGFQMVSYAQVSNVLFYYDGNTAIINYSLKKKADVSLYVSVDGGKTYKIKLKEVSGDVGENISSGNDKRIVWNILEEYPYGISSDYVCFKVEAINKSSQHHYSNFGYGRKSSKRNFPNFNIVWRKPSFHLLLGGCLDVLNLDYGAIARLGIAGVYVGYKTNFVFDETGLKSYPGDIYTDYFDDDSKQISRNGFMVGYIWNKEKSTSFFTGVGYGIRTCTASKDGEIWKIDENSVKGAELELGINVMRQDNVGFSIGYSMLDFKYSDINAAIVFKF